MGPSNDGKDHIITRGNVDGIISAAVFLNRFPEGKVTFVASPATAARELSCDRSSDRVYIVDMSVTEALAGSYHDRRKDQIVRFIDHHQASSYLAGISDIMIDEGRSAAGSLHLELGSEPSMDGIVALADLAEMSNTDVLQRTIDRHGRRSIEDEVNVLDMSWRADVNDDPFRLRAAKHLSKAVMPSKVPEVLARYEHVLELGIWPRALDRVRRSIEKRGPLGIYKMERRTSLNGFGSKAVSEVARELGCDYAIIINDGADSLSVSLRSLGSDAINLGQFAETFTKANGHDGGGHPNSAGARVPRSAGNKLISELELALN